MDKLAEDNGLTAIDRDIMPLGLLRMKKKLNGYNVLRRKIC
jgi:hypothetical protein